MSEVITRISKMRDVGTIQWPISQTTALQANLDAKRSAVIKCRNHYTGKFFQDKKFYSATASGEVGAGLGNSIMAGQTAVGGATDYILYKVGALLATFTGIGVGSNWAPINRAVGSSTAANALSYIADYASGSPSTTSLVLGRGSFWSSFTAPYVIVQFGRNDGSMSLVDFTMSLRLIVRAIIAQGKDPILCVDPPAIDFNGDGSITDVGTTGLAGDRRYAILRVAAEEGCTSVDHWLYFYLRKQAGEDIRPYYIDNSHTSSAGNSLIAQNDVDALLGESEITPRWRNRSSFYMPYAAVVANYTPASAGGGGSTTPATLTGTLNQNTTAREIQLSEGSYKGFVLSAGQSVTFFSNGVHSGVAIPVFSGPDYNTGSLTVAWSNGGGGSVTGLTTSVTALREYTHFIKTGTGTGSVTVTAVGATAAIAGVIFLGPEQQSLTAYPYYEAATGKVGTWTPTNLSTGQGGIQGTTVGDAYPFWWYGTDLSCLSQRGSAQGRWQPTTDGSAGTVFDQYLSGTGVIVRQIATGLPLGWHLTAPTILSKNASSSGTGILLGQFKVQSAVADMPYRYVPMLKDEAVNVPGVFQTARIESNLSGSPTLLFSPAASTITSGGSASTDKALVRLDR